MQSLIQKMQPLTLSKKILLTSLLLTSSVAVFAQDVGSITEHKGSGGIKREKLSFPTAQGLGVQPMDKIETAKGRMRIEFLEASALNLVEGTEVVLLEHYYNQKERTGKLAMRVVAGTARFTTGRLGLIPVENIAISTPTATIAIRGTDFTTTVDELGRSLVILLPKEDCTLPVGCPSSGSIVVSNQGGEVTLTEAYQATMVSSTESVPSQPVQLDHINLAMIDNMFIVNPPKEIKERLEEEETSNLTTGESLLEFNELETDYLAEDFLAEDDLEFTELDMDLLDVDFLQDVLVAIEEVDILKRSTKSQLSTSISFTGTSPGFDKATQYNTIIDQGAGQIWFYRDVNGIISARIPIGSNTTLETTNEGKRNLITVGDGQSVVIIINQSG